MSINAGKKLAICALGTLMLLPGCRHAVHEAPLDFEEASVNDEKIMAPEFYNALRIAAGPAVLQRLVEEKLVLQEAKRQNVALDDSEIKDRLEAIDKETKDPGIKKVFEDEVRARALSRKLLLKDVTEERKHEIYEHFKDELKQYELYDVLVANKEDADGVESDLKKGVKFDVVAVSSSFDQRSKSHGGRLGWVTMPVLKDMFGARVASVIEGLKEGQTSPPVAAQGAGFLVLKVGKTKSSYEDLKSSIEDLLSEAGRPALMYRLLSSAQITSHYLPPPSVAPNGKGPSIPDSNAANQPLPGNSPAVQLPHDNPNIPIPQDTQIQIPSSPPSPVPAN